MEYKASVLSCRFWPLGCILNTEISGSRSSVLRWKAVVLFTWKAAEKGAEVGQKLPWAIPANSCLRVYSYESKICLYEYHSSPFLPSKCVGKSLRDLLLRPAALQYQCEPGVLWCPKLWLERPGACTLAHLNHFGTSVGTLGDHVSSNKDTWETRISRHGMILGLRFEGSSGTEG